MSLLSLLLPAVAALVLLLLLPPLASTQFCPPLTDTIIEDALNNDETLIYDVNFNRFLCLSYGPNINQILTATVFTNANVTIRNENPSPFSTLLFVLRCTSIGIWTAEMSMSAVPSLSEQPLVENCSQCQAVNGAPVCTPCNVSCPVLGGSGRCFGTGSNDCCPFYFNGTCSSTCPIGSDGSSPAYTCEPVPTSISIEVMGAQYGFIPETDDGFNLYIYDPMQGSPNGPLTVMCTFSAADNAMSELMSNSYWVFDLMNNTVESQVQSEPFGAIITSATNLTFQTSSGEVSVMFVPGVSMTFVPSFVTDLQGRYACGVRNISFATINEPVLLAISSNNPFLINDGPSTLNLIFPVTSFNHSITAIYRTLGQGQRIATNELQVFYIDLGGAQVFGSISLLNMSDDVYQVTFNQPLPPIVILTVRLSVSGLSAADFSLQVNSHGIEVTPSSGTVNIMEGGTTVLNCTSLVPTVNTSWSGPGGNSTGPTLTLANIGTNATGVYICTVQRGNSGFPGSLSTVYSVTVIVYPSDVILHRGLALMPNPSVINDRASVTVVCNGFSGGLVWTSDNPSFPSNLSLLNMSNPVFVAPPTANSLSLIITSSGFMSPAIRFTCYSTVSGANASVIVTSESVYSSSLSQPTLPLVLGQRATYIYIAVWNSDGLTNQAEPRASIVDVTSDVTAPQLVDPSNPFIYEFSVTASSLLNGTRIRFVIVEGAILIPILVSVPTVSVVTQPPYRYVVGSNVSLQCQVSSDVVSVTWISNSTQQKLLPPLYNRSSTNNNTLLFTPYIYNFSINYPPPNLGLTALTPATSNMVQLMTDTLLCTLCDNMDTNGTNCLPNEYLNPQYLPVEILYHPVSLFLNNGALYNNSIVTLLRGTDITLSCLSTTGNSNLLFSSTSSAISQYLSLEDYTMPLELPGNNTLEVMQVDSNEIVITFGEFTQSLSGVYTCLSRESNIGTSVTLEYSPNFVLVYTESFNLTLGTTAFIPFAASYGLSRGTPRQSAGTYELLRIAYPSAFSANRVLVSGLRAANLYEISPFQYGIYLPTVLGDIAGTTVIDSVEGNSPSGNFTITINIPVLTPVRAMVVVNEGQSATLSCRPSNSQVQLEWRYQANFGEIDPVSFFGSSSITYDSKLRHSITVSSSALPAGEGIYYCYVAGDTTDQYAVRAQVTLNVLQTCPESVGGGVVWPATLEGMSASVPCSMTSRQFNSQIVFARRYCVDKREWSPVLFDGCTLVSGGVNPFQLFTLRLSNASNVNTVSRMDTQITDELFTTLNTSNPHIISVTITRYFLFSSNVIVVGEAIYNITNMTVVDVAPLLMLQSLAGFSVNQSDTSFNSFQPFNICECISFIADAPVIISGIPEIPEGAEGPVMIFSAEQSFQRLCYGVVAEPCNCTLNMNCTCISPFLGNTGYITNCTVDTDSDGYPDQAIDVMFAPECTDTNNTVPPQYCSADTCPTLYNVQQMPPICNNLTLAVTGGCPPETDPDWNIFWPSVSANTTATQNCPGGTDSTGLATRYCDTSGNWLSVNVSSCRSRIVRQIETVASALFTVDPVTLSPVEVEALAQNSSELINQLSTATNVTNNMSLFPEDLSVTNDVLLNTIGALNASFISNNVTAVNQTAIADVLSNVLNSVNLPGWQSLQQSNPTMGSELLLENAETYGLYLAQSRTMEEVLSRENIVIQARQFSVNTMAYTDVSFPGVNDLVNFTNTAATGATINIPSSLIAERATGRTSVPVVNILFNNLQDFLQSSNVSGMQPGSIILSSQVATQRGTASESMSLLTRPVQLSFSISVANFTNPSCVFWDFSNPLGQGSFSSAGIVTQSSSSSSNVTCLSSHLTSFAVLVDVSGFTPAESKVLSVISYIGASISIICLILTVIFFLSFGKQLFEAVHNFVHLNLAIALLLGYIVFVAGIETADRNKAACTVVAALLHYFFLSAFFWMLCEGIMLYLMLVVVFSSISKKWWFFLLLGWVPSLLIVIISVGVAHDYYTEGQSFCWLSVDRHVIWAFIVPMLLIIIINSVFLIIVVINVVKNRGAKNARKQQENKRIDLVKATVMASIILLPLLGLMWVFGLLAVDQNTSFFAWIFTILNSLQGLAIFFFHVVRNERVWKYISGKYKKLTFHSTSESSGSHKVSGKKYRAKTATTSGGSSAGRYELASIVVDDEKKISHEPETTQFDEKKELEKQLEQEPDITKAVPGIVETETQKAVMLNEYEEAPAPTALAGDSGGGMNKYLKVQKTETGDSEEEKQTEEEEHDYKLQFVNRDDTTIKK